MDKIQKADRVPFWDTAKGILIFLVVFAHFIYAYYDYIVISNIVEVIYFFHMPAFIFISGYFSRSEHSKSFESLIKLLILFFVFNTGFLVYYIFAEHSYQLLNPFYSYWYIIALVFWRIIVKFFQPNRLWLSISILISLLIGFWIDIDNTLALARTVAFFPFFLAGYLLPDKDIKKYFTSKNKRIYIIGSIILVLTILLAFIFSSRFDLISNLLMEAYSNSLDFFLRLFILAIAFIITISLISVIPNKSSSKNIIEKWGRNSLWIYVLHRPVTLLFEKVYGDHDTYLLPVALIVSFLTVLVLGSETVVKPLNKLLNKTVAKIISIRLNIKGKLSLQKLIFAIVILIVLSLPLADRLLNKNSTDVVEPNLNFSVMSDQM